MNFSTAKKKDLRNKWERILLICYAVAVTGAFLVYVYNNNSVKASIPENLSVVEQIPEEDLDPYLQDTERDLEDEADPLQDNIDLSSYEIEDPQSELMVQDEITPEVEEEIVVEKGDSFISILTKRGVDYNQANQIYTAFKPVYDVKKIRVKQVIHLSIHEDRQSDQSPVIHKVWIEPVSGTRYIVEKTDENNYQARTEQEQFVKDVKIIKGVINGNVSTSMSSQGVPLNVIGNFINIFSFSVDFRRDVKNGDQFEVRYERQLSSSGEEIKSGDILFAALQLGKDRTELYRFQDKKGNADYYNENGLALKKNLDRKPMEFKRARISSRFGRRLHPILKDYRNHHGVDYAAPSGTKVYASGDGVITMAKWYGGYGNFISIRHNSEYTTGYGHLKSFAKGIRPGVRVKQGQVIAYVGNTGRSTGPHLHFEVVRHGKKVDPLKVKAATGENLSGEKLREFKKIVSYVKSLDQENKSLAANNSVAEKIEIVN